MIDLAISRSESEEDNAEETVVFMPPDANMEFIDLIESARGMQGDMDISEPETVPEKLTLECSGEGEGSVADDKEISSQCSVTESESKMEKGFSWFCGIRRLFRRKRKSKKSDACTL